MKKIVLKKKIAKPAEETHKLRMVPAIEMEDGVEYVNTMCNVILTLKDVVPYEGPLKGVAALRETKVHCKGLTDLGEHIDVTYFGTMGVLADETAMAQDIRNRCARSQARAAALKGAKRSTAPAVGPDGKPKERKSRGEVDPRTGCSAGSQGHVLGTIMLDNKCSPATRQECVRLMTECLVKEFGMDERKAKPLAQSWYSTLWTRKPQIYQAGR